MKKILIFLVFLFQNSCSLNKDSKYWNEDAIKDEKKRKILSKIMKKKNNFAQITLEEYEIYINDYIKKSKYPDITK